MSQGTRRVAPIGAIIPDADRIRCRHPKAIGLLVPALYLADVLP